MLHARLDELQYGGRTFAAASEFARFALRRSEPGTRYPATRWPAGAAALVYLIARLPRMTVSLTDSPGGRVIGEHLRARQRLGIRSHLVAQGVIELPRTPDGYPRGRHRQAVRTNTARAVREGVRCTPLENGRSATSVVRRLAERGLVTNADVLLARRADEWLVAVDRDDDVVGGALVSVDRAWAMLNILVGAAYPVRYALHTDLVRRLGADGVEHMFVSDESALVLPDGLQYLQRILGYRVVNLSLRRA